MSLYKFCKSIREGMYEVENRFWSLYPDEQTESNSKVLFVTDFIISLTLKYDNFSISRLWNRHKFHKEELLFDKFSEAISGQYDYHKIKYAWESYFHLVLKNWGFNKYSRECLFNWGKYGHNWKILWHDENPHPDAMYYDVMTKEKLTESFLGEVSYCMDRMSLDRLFRCHWIYNKLTYEDRKNKE